MKLIFKLRAGRFVKILYAQSGWQNVRNIMNRRTDAEAIADRGGVGTQ
jgi:hypothetical protein